MQSLHLVGYTEDRAGLIFTAGNGSRAKTYVLHIDPTLVGYVTGGDVGGGDGTGGPADGDGDVAAGGTAVEVAQVRRPATPVARAAVSALTPREIQARLRTGRSVAEVAAEAGVDEAWVERFAAPVLAEQAAAIAQAAVLHLSTPRRGLSARPLADAVPRALRERDVAVTDEELAAGWSARQLAGSEWVVTLVFRQRGRAQRAEWSLDMGSRSLVARNRLATELSWTDTPGSASTPDPAHPASPGIIAGAKPVAPRQTPRPAARRRTDAPANGLRSTASPLQGSPAGTTRGAGPAGTARTAAGKAGAAHRATPRKARTPERATAKKAAVAERAVASRIGAAERAAARKAAVADRAATTARRDAERNAAKAADAVGREAARKALAATRGAERAAARTAGAAARAAERDAARRSKAAEREAVQKARAAEREAAQKVRAAEREAAQKARATEREASRRAAAAERAATRKLASAERSAAARAKAVEREVAKRIAAAERAVARTSKATTTPTRGAPAKRGTRVASTVVGGDGPQAGADAGTAPAAPRRVPPARVPRVAGGAEPTPGAASSNGAAALLVTAGKRQPSRRVQAALAEADGRAAAAGAGRVATTPAGLVGPATAAPAAQAIRSTAAPTVTATAGLTRAGRRPLRAQRVRLPAVAGLLAEPSAAPAPAPGPTEVRVTEVPSVTTGDAPQPDAHGAAPTTPAPTTPALTPPALTPPAPTPPAPTPPAPTPPAPTPPAPHPTVSSPARRPATVSRRGTSNRRGVDLPVIAGPSAAAPPADAGIVIRAPRAAAASPTGGPGPTPAVTHRPAHVRSGEGAAEDLEPGFRPAHARQGAGTDAADRLRRRRSGRGDSDPSAV